LLKLSGTNADIKQPEAMCWRNMEGCDYAKAFPSYDPAEAKRLLAEAGYANGMKIELYVLEGRTRQQAEAISGMWRKVGIEATVHPIVNSIYGKMQLSGELSLYIGIWSAAGVPDVTRTMEQFFAASPRNYNNDAELDRLTKLVAVTLDPAERKGYAKTAFDIANDQVYVLPIAANDIPFIYTKEVRIEPNTFDPYGVIMSHIYWK
jgi:peptide/nickel transport system substrate-binding protein